MAVAISCIRLVCAVVIIALHFTGLPPHSVAFISNILVIIAFISDFLDGAVARFWKIKSHFGAIVDQIVDKMFFYSVAIFLLVFQDLGALSWLAIILLLMRDFLFSAVRQYDMKFSAPTWSGINKLKTGVQNLFLCSAFFSKGGNFVAIEHYGYFMLWIAVFLSYLSLLPVIKHYGKF